MKLVHVFLVLDEKDHYTTLDPYTEYVRLIHNG